MQIISAFFVFHQNVTVLSVVAIVVAVVVVIVVVIVVVGEG